VSLTDVKSLRARLVEAAMGVAHERGLDGITVRAVADSAGVTAPAIYWHFADKEALVRDVAREIARVFKGRMFEAAAATGSEERLRKSLDAFRRFAIEHPAYFDALFVHPRTTRATIEPRGTIFQLLIERVAECMRDGTIRADHAESVAMTFAALAQGLVILYRRGRFTSEADFRTFFELSVQRLLTGLR
jgi:AcrR family transcriptional regulator